MKSSDCIYQETGIGWERNWRYNAAGRLSEIKDSADGLTVQYRYETPLGEELPRLSRKAQQAAPPTTSTAKAP